MPGMDDAGTAAYFEAHSQDYHPARLRVAAHRISRMRRDGDTLFDIGCGTGAVLQAMRDAGITGLAGCDAAAEALRVAGQRVEFTAHHGSILDRRFAAGLGTYRFVTMDAVLHHVVKPTRRRSREAAVVAVRHAPGLLAPEGRLVILEPTYRPRRVMTLLFWAKRLVIAAFGNRRLEVGRWNNLEASLVAYYSPDEVAAIVEDAGGRVLRRRDRETRLRLLPRLAGVRGRWFTTVMVAAGEPPHHPH